MRKAARRQACLFFDLYAYEHQIQALHTDRPILIQMMERGIQIKGADDPDPRAFDTDAVLVGQEEIEEQFAQVAELNKTMEDMKSEHAFALHRKTAELLEDLKQVVRVPCV